MKTVLMAILSFLYYWIRDYSEYHKEGSTIKDWVVDRLDDIALSVLAIIMLMLLVPYAYEWAAHQWKLDENSISFELYTLLASLIIGYLNTWFFDSIIGLFKNTIGKFFIKKDA